MWPLSLEPPTFFCPGFPPLFSPLSRVGSQNNDYRIPYSEGLRCNGKSINELHLYNFWKIEVRKYLPSNKVQQRGDFQLLNSTRPCLVTQAVEVLAAFPAAAADFELFSLPQLHSHEGKAKGPACC